MGSFTTVVVLVLAIALVAFNLYATRLCLRHELDPGRRLAQLALAWLVPFVGAGFVALAHQSSTSSSDPSLDYTRPIDDAAVPTLLNDAHHD